MLHNHYGCSEICGKNLMDGVGPAMCCIQLRGAPHCSPCPSPTATFLSNPHRHPDLAQSCATSPQLTLSFPSASQCIMPNPWYPDWCKHAPQLTLKFTSSPASRHVTPLFIEPEVTACFGSEVAQSAHWVEEDHLASCLPALGKAPPFSGQRSSLVVFDAVGSIDSCTDLQPAWSRVVDLRRGRSRRVWL